MTRKPPPDRSLAPALEELARRDADIARVLADCGLPPVRRQPRGLTGLVRIVAAQQVSAASARALDARLRQRLPQISAAGILALGEAGLREAGFSRPKVRYLLSLAAALSEKRFSLARLHRLADEAAIAYLAEQPGFGRWSGECYLLFSLRRPDVMPAGDLALQAAAQRVKRLAERPNAGTLYELSEVWRPHRSAAARLLWHAYRHPGLPG